MMHILHSDDVMTTLKTNALVPAKSEAALRASVSFPPDLYHILEQIAAQKKVSLAWVVRDAAEKYVADQWPLFNNNS